uniref:Ankyrin repeat protein n=1 Tax=Ditylum brightwellii TaxID=49249 RepID=A0A7S4T1H8_9STRA
MNVSQPHADPELKRLLCLVDEEIDEKAVIKAIQKNPSVARAKYKASYLGPDFPLYIAIKRGASFGVVNAIFRAYPEAVKEKNSEDETILHGACRMAAPFEIVSLLWEGWPDAVNRKNRNGQTPLHCACSNHASVESVTFLMEKCPQALAEKEEMAGQTPLHCACTFSVSHEVVSFLLKACPTVVEEKNKFGQTLLHSMCSINGNPASLDTLLLLLKYHPEAVRIKDNDGRMPLHYACKKRVSIDVVTLLLEKNPSAVEEKDIYGETPLHLMCKYCTPAREKMILSHVSCLVSNRLDRSVATKMMRDFIEIKWQGGLILLFELFPLSVTCLNHIPMSIVPSLLSMMGRHCKILTMSTMMINRQDVLNIY